MYLDTAILVKLFVAESDSEFFGRLVDGQPVASSAIAYTEFWSALLAKERAGAITAEQRRRAWSAFRHDVEEDTIELISVSQATFKKANHILDQCHPKVALRSLDALHLAACDQTQDWPLCTSDTRMRQAAEVLRFDLSPLPS
jgi:predicted nucleic acid-binding protein